VTRILVVDDEPQILRALGTNLKARGYEVDLAPTGEVALTLAARHHPDLVILDLGLPGIDGIEVIRGLRGWTHVPILVLSVREAERDKVAALDAGADDYVTKPFSVNELIARMRAIFRRVARPSASPEVVEIGEAKVGFSTHILKVGGVEHALSFYEVELLRLLVERIGQPVSRDEILQKIWGLEAAPTNRTVDNFIVKLRKKIERHPDKPVHILTVYGYGYKLAALEAEV
jgi:DNA-binding response OmpR family regulator